MDIKFLTTILKQNSPQDYLISLVILIVGISLFRFIVYLGFKLLNKYQSLVTEEFQKDLEKALKKVIPPIGYFGIIYFSLKRLTFNSPLNTIFRYGSIIIITFLGIRFLTILVNYSIERYYSKQNKLTSEMISGINLISKIFIWIFGIIFLLDNLGFKVSTLVTGIGIGGVAIALATQTILGDLLSYLAILFDKPFKEDDFLIIGEYLGVVEHIGIKTTRIRSLNGEELIFSNTDLLNSRIKNYTSMKERRVLFKLGVKYSTPAEKLEKIPEIIKGIIESVEDTRFDRCHFASYGDFNLIIETVYYIYGADYNKFMDINQKVNLGIKRKFEEEGIEFAFPTRTIHLDDAEKEEIEITPKNRS